ncbi:serine hydrolase domain-containing protein [Stratiformator vulcanicus]|uniref:Esterase EstB n=1 Tax=Stratiformator vulcanicus TaxID=2527980 RepID=A0A517R130_9PLAN|nr:serine hydrolase domain-containing protein [Stratiformator vulcanicus]QDT37544.1 Esterase EstB [Stratiformator vulcanicus]
MHHRIRIALTACVASVSIAAISVADSGSAVRTEAEASIEAVLSDAIAEGEAVGMVALVADGADVIHLSSAGRAGISAEEPLATDALFAIASMTKPIASTAVMMLVDEGRLSLDDPVSDYIPEFGKMRLKDGSTPDNVMTVRHLLTHTSGLGGDQRTEETLEKTAQVIAQRPLLFEPGTKWNYSPGITVAGRIVEIVAEQPFENFLKDRLFVPLQMKDATFFPTQAQRDRMAELYGRNASGELEPAEYWIWKEEPNRAANPSAGLVCSAADLHRFYAMILNGGEWDGRRYLSEKSVALMTSLRTGEITTGFTPGCGWGLGWCVIREPQGVTRSLSVGSYGHGGALGTHGTVDPQRGRIYILLMQRKSMPVDSADLRGEFLDAAAALR